MPNATMVGKQIDSKNRTMYSMERPVFSRCVIAGAMKTMHMARKTRKTMRGLMYRMRKLPKKRPIVNPA